MRMRTASGAMTCLLLIAGCGNPDGSTNDNGGPSSVATQEHLNVAPSTLEQATAEVQRANTLLAAGADATRIASELGQLREHMDLLNGLVDRVQIASDHVVSFYQSAEGLVVGERAPQGVASAISKLDLSHLSVAELHLRLAPTLPVPQALLNSRLATEQPMVEKAAPSPAQAVNDDVPVAAAGQRPVAAAAAPGPGVDVVQSALTAADGPYFRSNYCPIIGVYSFCFPNAGNWANAQASATHSDLAIAPYAGAGAASVTIKVNGSLLASLAAFNGEVDKWWAISGTHSVRDSGCCFICACGTHPEVVRYTHRWDVTATGKSFHVGGYFLNDPRHLSPE